jgi:hypothetical protein
MNAFKKMLKDEVTLKRANGDEYPQTKASVQKNKIFIMDSTIPIEEGDKLYRTLSNGLQEVYLVIDPGFREKFRSLNAHLNVKLEKTRPFRINSSHQM